ncbi:fumarylacetoacetate hydrolase family protein [Dissulfurirhabdus thermomarina]|uniref:Fumarylacetoacetate hydrolase family protein n=1 Tax=Dissulfurirhabdus thermomarina TaxID=1765737 RepID=A0A6N9TNX7_DISTH|nr:fumarylacetoacetate hydrolase family protein [Dissulfurirhabdus thermomarina]NDY42758.1 fumarylacetoacetate hydrolase family protein [Dissulfurirhabdus thermomarina]NMX22600.1 fumarylacetoacetate hydrolase family protein [Dissulfurirhabdus thermomarina]
MKIVRFRRPSGGPPGYGRIEGDQVVPLAGDPFSAPADGGPPVPLDAVTLLAPCRPTKIAAVGLNYRDHAEELGMALPDEPLLFLKPPSAVIGPGAPIVIPPESRRVDHEAELAVVIGRRARRVPPEEAGAYILGYTCLNDVTARDLQHRDVQFTRAKGFDTFCPLGPHIETDLDPSDLAVECRVNGERRQASRTRHLIHAVPELVAFISGIMTLEPGDVIATGTPSGIGPISPGDRVAVRVEGIGTLENPVAAPAAP